MAIGTLTAKLTESIVLSGQNTLTGSDYSPLTSSQAITTTYSLGTSAANAAAGGADEAASFLTTIAASGSASIDLTSLTDIMQTSAVSLARLKVLILRLLSAAQDATNGTAAAYVTVDGTVANALLSATGSGWLNGATSKIDVPNGAKLALEMANGAGVAVSGTSKIVKIINGDAGLSAKPQLTVVGGTT